MRFIDIISTHNKFMDREIQTRLRWVNLYGDVGNAGMVCQRCGILRPTLRKWIKRYEQFGLEGLKEKSRRPKTSPKRKMADEKADWS